MAPSLPNLRAVTTAEFYSTAGAGLLDLRNYSRAICDHLASEKKCVKHTVRKGGYTTAIEVGCADGSLHMQTLLSLKLRYLGIDLVPRFISILNDKLQNLSPDQLAGALVLDAQHISNLRPVMFGQKALLVFSFNSFGNVDDPSKALAQACVAGFDVLILTYRTNGPASQRRSEYYAQCNLSGLRHDRNERGVVFCSDDGLHSYAYRRPWLMGLLRRYPFHCTVREFGMLGRSYWCRRSKEG
jgi:hypothetical protein